jgi:hypothetical protein
MSDKLKKIKLKFPCLEDDTDCAECRRGTCEFNAISQRIRKREHQKLKFPCLENGNECDKCESECEYNEKNKKRP